MLYAEINEPTCVGATVYVKRGSSYHTASRNQNFGDPGIVQSIQGNVALIKLSASPLAVSTGTAMGVTVKLPITAKAGLTITYEI